MPRVRWAIWPRCRTIFSAQDQNLDLAVEGITAGLSLYWAPYLRDDEEDSLCCRFESCRPGLLSAVLLAAYTCKPLFVWTAAGWAWGERLASMSYGVIIVA